MLPRVDTPPISYEQFTATFEQWLTNLVDILNISLTQIEAFIQNIITAQTANIGGGGAGPIDVAVVGLTADSIVTANIVSSSNAVSILTILPGIDKFSVTFSANPGASAILSYTAYIQPTN